MLIGALGALLYIGASTRRVRITPPAQLLDLGPIWVGDFCRDNVAHHRYPPGWCPRDYTLYLILRTGSSGAIYPLLRIPDTTPSAPGQR